MNFTSDEKLPDWPEEFPGINILARDIPTPSQTVQFDSSDVLLINSLANLAPGALVDEIRAMRTVACTLAFEEEKEKTRGKILRVLLD